MKRYFPVFAASLFAFSILFSGCTERKASDAVMVVNGEEVGRSEFEYQLESVMTAYEQYSGRPIDWSLPIDGKSADEYFKDQAAENVILYRAVRVKSEEMGLALTEEELKQVDQSVQDLVDQAGGEKEFEKQLKARNLDRDLLKYILSGPEAYYKIFQALYGEGGDKTPSDESVREYFHNAYLRTRHIMMYLTDDAGSPLDSAAQQERRDAMDDIYSRLKSGEDFEALMDEYNEDAGINGSSISFSYGEMPEDYYQASIALEPGNYSEVIELDGALCIINRLPLDDAFLDENYDSVREESATESFNSLLEEWKSELTVDKTPLYGEIDAQTVYSSAKS